MKNSTDPETYILLGDERSLKINATESRICGRNTKAKFQSTLHADIKKDTDIISEVCIRQCRIYQPLNIEKLKGLEGITGIWRNPNHTVYLDRMWIQNYKKYFSL